jgi:hypothetical protein
MNAHAAQASDPRRAEVERWLHAIVSAGLAVPAAAAATLRRCLGARLGPVTERVAEPVRVVRSIVELVAGAGPAGGAGAERETRPDPEPVVDMPNVVGEEAQLPIDEYESLAASHVVDRLANLTADELRVVRRFEVSHRGRRTVIGRIDQLLAAHDVHSAG